MIQFFRRVRHNLLAEGQSSKYIKYAIGEIFLVVIGILIALQINGWYQGQLDHKKEITYLDNIRHDLEEQLRSCESQRNFESQFAEAAFRLLNNYEDQSKLLVDSLFAEDLSTLTVRKTFVRDDPTFTDLVSSGNISLIRNIELKNNIIQLYHNLERFEQIVRNNNSLFTDQQFVPMVMEMGYLLRKLVTPRTNSSMDTLGNDKRETNKRLLSISQRLLGQEENELWLINSINLRYTVAQGHLTLLSELEKEIALVSDQIKMEIGAENVK